MERQKPDYYLDQVKDIDYGLIDEEFRPRSYGGYQERWIRLGDIAICSQVRLGVNPVHAELKESIDKDGLLHHPTVGGASQDLFEEYLDFTKHAYKSKKSLEDYRRTPQGTYLPLLAGHSRLLVIAELETERQKNAADNGHITNYLDTPVKTHLMAVNTPLDIVNVQFSENLHTQPSEERKALAIAELFNYGKFTGLWKSRKEFIEFSHETLSNLELNRALLFQDLPENVRELVVTGFYKFAPSIEIAKLVEPRISFLKEYYFGNVDQINDEDLEEIELNAFNLVFELLEKSRKKRWSIKTCKNVVQGHLKDMRDSLAVIGGDSDNVLVMRDPISEWNNERRRNSRLIRELIREISKEKVDAATRAQYVVMDTYSKNPKKLEELRGVIIDKASTISSELMTLANKQQFGLFS